MKAFYFAKEDRKLRYGDNRQIVVGESHSVEGELELCKWGLHGSKRLIDALSYAPGPILYHVELTGWIEGDDKIVAKRRKYLAEYDSTDVLLEFARKQALINIDKIKPHCSSDDYDLIIQFLKTGDEELRPDAAAWAASAAAWAVSAAAWAASAAARAASEAANKMLKEMIKEKTGWDI